MSGRVRQGEEGQTDREEAKSSVSQHAHGLSRDAMRLLDSVLHRCE
jgi:hypothetical protein